jgi:hypothetical protein
MEGCTCAGEALSTVSILSLAVRKNRKVADQDVSRKMGPERRLRISGVACRPFGSS